MQLKSEASNQNLVCQAIIWTNAGILLIRPLGTKPNEMFIKIHTFSFRKTNLEISSGKWRPFVSALNTQIISFVVVDGGGGGGGGGGGDGVSHKDTFRM